MQYLNKIVSFRDEIKYVNRFGATIDRTRLFNIDTFCILREVSLLARNLIQNSNQMKWKVAYLIEINRFISESVEYKACGDCVAVLSRICDKIYHFKVPSLTKPPNSTIEYLVLGISHDPQGESATIISFDSLSEIKEVNTALIGKCKNIFYLPPKIKRIRGTKPTDPHYYPIVISENPKQRFVSVIMKHIIMNNFPFELAYQQLSNRRPNIRETTRFIGQYAMYGNSYIKIAILPPSVEFVGDYAFYGCRNLRTVRFMGNSKLKRIGRSSFSYSQIEYVNIPIDVEEIRNRAFYCCRKLKQVTICKNSKLRIIGEVSFSETSIKYIFIPPRVEEIGVCAFSDCKFLKQVTFSEYSKLKIIGGGSFESTAIESLVVPASVEKIGSQAFLCCQNLNNVIFSKDSHLKVLGNCSFSFAIMESISIPYTVMEI